MAKGQAERLFPLIDEVLDSASVSWNDLSAVGVGVGPGNFTGIRIAVASARGLSMSLEVPAIAVSSFEALAFGNSGQDVLTVVDGRRGNVHFHVFPESGKPGRPETIPVDTLTDRFAGRPLCVVGYCADDIAQSLGPTASVGASLPIAEAVARAAAAKLGSPVEPPKPLYVRPADAAPPREVAPTILP